MRKFLVIVFLLTCCSALSACKSTSDKNYFDETSQIADTLLQCLVNKDAEGIKSMMCERLQNAPDVDTQLQNFMNSIDGTVLASDDENQGSWAIGKAGYLTDTNGNYVELHSMGTLSNLKTDTGKIYSQLLFGYGYIDKTNPDLLGFYSIVLAEKR